MSKRQRIQNVILGLVMLYVSIVMIRFPDQGYLLIAILLSISFTLSGIQALFYYFTMARFMVGGKRMLFRGMIFLDLGLFTSTLVDSSKFYVILYIFVINAIAGAIGILRSREAKQYEAPSWKFSMAYGVVNLLMALFCIVFIWSTEVIVYIYCAGLIYDAIFRIVSAFRRTAIISV